MAYATKGICARSIEVNIEDGVIKDVNFVGGCAGNLIGISKLVKGRKAEDVIEELRGVTCGNKPTSCPDQLTYAIEEALAQQITA